jgi:hypothetical protein
MRRMKWPEPLTVLDGQMAKAPRVELVARGRPRVWNRSLGSLAARHSDQRRLEKAVLHRMAVAWEERHQEC